MNSFEVFVENISSTYICYNGHPVEVSPLTKN